MADPFIGEIRAFCFDYPPLDWAYCSGTTVPAVQNQALAAVIGNIYGGDHNNVGLPNLQGRTPMDQGTGPGLTPRTVAAIPGEIAVTLSAAQFAAHSHTVTEYAPAPATLVNAPSSTAYLARTLGQKNYKAPPIDPSKAVTMETASIGAYTGGVGAHENRQPYQVFNFCICLVGNFPYREE